MQINFIHICNYAFLSQDGKLNVIGIFKQINARKFPYIHPKISVVTNITINEDIKLKIQILKKEAMEIVSKIEANLNAPKEAKGKKVEVGFISDFNMVKFESVGDYLLEVWVNDTLEKTISFRLNLI